MFDNTDLLILLVKEFHKDENRENGYLNDLLSKAIQKEANHDFMDLDMSKLAKELDIKYYDDIKPYFDNLMEFIYESDILIAEKNYYRQAYDD